MTRPGVEQPDGAGLLRLRPAFLGTTYGTPDERVRLAPVSRGAARPSWAAGSWGLLTAWNPGGQRRSAADNAAAQAVLMTETQGFSPVPGVSGEGEWAEAALILPGLRLREAVRLGQRHGQAAVLWGAGRRAALVWLLPEGPRAERVWLHPTPFHPAPYTAAL